jgi:Type IV pilin-like G and H, putative
MIGIEIVNLEQENIAYTTAIPDRDNLLSFVGAVYYDKQIGSYNNVICQSDRPSKVLAQSPTVSENKLKCPPNFRYLPDFVIDRINPSPVRNKEIEAKNSIDIIIRLEQVYFFQRGEFTDKLQSLDIPLPKNSFYSFKISISDQKFVYVTAIPTQDDLSSFVGALTYNDRTSSFENISCQSDRPGKLEAEPPSVIDETIDSIVPPILKSCHKNLGAIEQLNKLAIGNACARREASPLGRIAIACYLVSDSKELIEYTKVICLSNNCYKRLQFKTCLKLVFSRSR